MRLSDLQVSQILEFLCNSPMEDPEASFQSALFLSHRGRVNFRRQTENFWMRPQFQKWNDSQSSSLIFVNGSIALQFQMRRFLVQVIECIRSQDKPVLWALHTPHSTRAGGISLIDLLKYLARQATTLKTPSTEKNMSASCSRFRSARTETQWFELLAETLAGLKQCYVVIDLELLDHRSMTTSADMTLHQAFSELLGTLAMISPGTVLKIVLVGYGPGTWPAMGGLTKENIIMVGAGRNPKVQTRRGVGLPLLGRGRGRGSKTP
jgi:hypothetical protein